MQEINISKTADVNFYIKRGDSFNLNFAVKYNGSLVDLSAYTSAKMQIRENEFSDPVLTYSGNTINISNLALGQIIISGETSSIQTSGIYYYDLQLSNTNNIETVMSGKIYFWNTIIQTNNCYTIESNNDRYEIVEIVGIINATGTTTGSTSSNLIFRNGLTKTGNVVQLGGEQIEDVEIIPSTSNLNVKFGNDSNKLYGFNVITESGSFVAGDSQFFLSAPNNILLTIPTKVSLNIDNTGSGIYTSNENIPLKYAANYSTNFDARSLVDKEYVDNKSSSGSTFTADNGLIKNGNNISLGGGLTGDTTIQGNNKDLNIGSFNNELLTLNLNARTVNNNTNLFLVNTPLSGGTDTATIYNDRTGVYLTKQAGSEVNTIDIFKESDDTVTTKLFSSGSNGDTTIQLKSLDNSFTVESSNVDFKGIQYNYDYSANFNARSVPDVAYVTGLTNPNVTGRRLLGRYSTTTGPRQEIQIGSGLNLNTSTGVLSVTGGTGGGTTYTASNGITLSNNRFQLGGTLTGNTSILPDTDLSRQLFIGNVSNRFAFIGNYVGNSTNTTTLALQPSIATISSTNHSVTVGAGGINLSHTLVTAGTVTPFTIRANGLTDVAGNGFVLAFDLAATPTYYNGGIGYRILNAGSTTRATAFTLRGKKNSSDVTFAQIGATTSYLNNSDGLVIGNTTLATSAILELSGSTKAILLSRSSNEANITTPVNGMLYYNSSLGKFRGYQNGSWTNIIASGGTGGSSYTFSNGLTSSSNVVRLGGNVTGTTYISVNDNNSLHIGQSSSDSRTRRSWLQINQQQADDNKAQLWSYAGTGAYALVSAEGQTSDNSIIRLRSVKSTVVNEIAIDSVNGITFSAANSPSAIYRTNGTWLFGANSGGTSSALVEFTSANKAILLPRLTGDTAISSAVNGMIYYNSTTNRFRIREGGSWLNLSGTGSTGSGLSVSAFNAYSASTSTSISNRLLTTAFNSYSASTATANSSALALKLNTSTFSSYSGTTNTAINNRLLISNFNSYSGTTNTAINNRLLTTAFNSYSASTATAISNKADKAPQVKQVGSSYTIVSGDNGYIIEITGSTNSTITVNTGLGSIQFTLNNLMASNTVTISGTATRQLTGNILATQYAGASLYTTGNNLRGFGNLT